MKTITTVLAASVLAACANVFAEDYSAFFRYEEGRRIDYSEAHPEGKIANDTITSKAVLHVRIPSGSDKADISLTYGGDGGLRPDDTWHGAVVLRSEDMITIVCLHTQNEAGEGIQKIENLIIYPKHGVGFSSWFSSQLAMPMIAAVLATDKSFPFGSAVVLRLKQLTE
jgi:hypothetical protein